MYTAAATVMPETRARGGKIKAAAAADAAVRCDASVVGLEL